MLLASRVFGQNPLCKLRCLFPHTKTHTDTYGKTQCRVVPLFTMTAAAAATLAHGLICYRHRSFIHRSERSNENCRQRNFFFHFLNFIIIHIQSQTCKPFVCLCECEFVLFFFLILVQLPADQQDNVLPASRMGVCVVVVGG